MNKCRAVCGVAAVFLFTACGGGGGGGGGGAQSTSTSPPIVPPPTTPPVTTPPVVTPPVVTPTTPPALSATMATFAGHVGATGAVDATGPAATFFGPRAIALDSAGNAYVAETSQIIRKISRDGVVTTLAGYAYENTSRDGVGAAARFNQPDGITLDSSGNIYVGDCMNRTVRKITPDSVVTTIAGAPGQNGYVDGSAIDARFSCPTGLVIDGSGSIYVADTLSHTIRKIAPSGVVTTFAGTAGGQGSIDAKGTAAKFYDPHGLVLDSAGNLFVTDGGNHTIRKITPDGTVSTLAGKTGISGSADGIGSSATFSSPSGISLDKNGNLYVTDYGNVIRKITADGVVSTVAGAAGIRGIDDGVGPLARFNEPQGIASDPNGNLVVADWGNSLIRRVSAEGVVSTFAGTPAWTGYADGIGIAAAFASPVSMAADSAGNIFVADSGHHVIRKITKAGAVTTYAGAPGVFGTVDGTAATARFRYPNLVAVDRAGNVYVSTDSAIRKISTEGLVTTLVGGEYVSGTMDGLGTVARFNGIAGLAVDGAGNVFASDTGNHTIRKITANGDVSTFAGFAGIRGHGDGVGPGTTFYFPNGIAIDAAGNLYVADLGNHLIRKITSTGVVTTLAGTAETSGSIDAVGSAARFNYPRGVAVDSAGIIYVADSGNNTIRTVDANGSVKTIVGQAGKGGFAPSALPGLISNPIGLAVANNALYFNLNNGIGIVSPLR